MSVRKIIIIIASEAKGLRKFWQHGDSEWEAWVNGAKNVSRKTQKNNIELKDEFLKIQCSKSCLIVFKESSINKIDDGDKILNKAKQLVNSSNSYDLYIHRGNYEVIKDMITKRKIKEGNTYTTNYPETNLFKKVVELIDKLNKEKYSSFCRLLED